MTEEVWKPVRGFEDYLISNHGEIKSLKRGKEIILVGDKNNYGYRRVRLSSGKYNERVFIHRLVAEHFVPNRDPRNRHYVNHKDGNKLNNRADNLQWVTAGQNIQHAFDNGLNATFRKLGWSQVAKIRNSPNASQEHLAKTYGVSIRTIFNIINYKSYLTESVAEEVRDTPF